MGGEESPTPWLDVIVTGCRGLSRLVTGSCEVQKPTTPYK